MSVESQFGKGRKVTKSAAMLFALLGIVLFVATSAGSAVTLNQTADVLNYFYHKTHNVTVTIGGVSGLSDFYVNVTVPTGWTITARSAGSVQAETNVITWRFASPTGSELIYYTMTSDTTVAELTKSTMASSYNHSTQASPIAGQNLTFVRIADTKVVDILEELGRGRGNYPYSTRYGGTQYIPASTTTQLYFLSRIYNIAQYLANTTESASAVTMFCDYPTYPTVTYHLVSKLVKGTSTWQANYSISEIEPSWWRMGYVGIEINNLAAGTQIHVNCTNLRYNFNHGSVKVDNQTFALTAATITPITVTAAASNVSINQGQTENVIIYNITNSGPYDVDSPQFELQAPTNSTWIGVRGELWGEGRSKYVFSLPRLQSQQSFNITLVARFDVSNAATITLGTLTSKFVPPWETTAYNPSELTQTSALSEAITVTAQTGAVIPNLKTEITGIRGVVNDLNNTATVLTRLVIQINGTVNSMNLTVNEINSTLYQLNNSVRATVIPLLIDIGNNVTAVNNTIKDVKALVDCSNQTFSGVCNKLNNITANLDNVNTTVVRINYTTERIDLSATIEQARRFDNINANLSLARNQVDEVKGYMNCTNSPGSSVCNKLDNVTTVLDFVNTTTQRALVVTNFINTTRWANFSAADLFSKSQDAIITTAARSTDILDKIRNLKELTQEAVFLVTDSVGLQTQAKDDLAKGDIGSAVAKLEKASTNLAEANALVEEYMNARVAKAEAGGTGTGMTGNAGLGVAGLGSAGIVIAVLLAGIVAGYAVPRFAGSIKLGERISAFVSAGKKTKTNRSGRLRRSSARKSKGRPARRSTSRTRRRK